MSIKINLKNLNTIWYKKFVIKGYLDLSFNRKDGLIQMAVDGNKDLQRVLSNPVNYYFITLRNNTLPYDLRRLVFKNGMTKENPNNIIEVRVKSFSYLAYGVQMLGHDGVNAILIINKSDIFNFIGLYKADKKRMAWNMEGWKHMEENEDFYGITTSIDYEKIFKLYSFYRKEFFSMCKACGMGASERKLLKSVRKASGGLSFDLYLEQLEEQMEELRGEPEAVQELEEVEREYLALTEEDNSWNNLTVNIDDYFYY